MKNKKIYNLETLVAQTTSIKAYVHNMRKLANQNASFKLLDKFHYLVNEKLGINSCLDSKAWQSVHDATFCPHCGNYVGHAVTEGYEIILVINDVKTDYGFYTVDYIEYIISDRPTQYIPVSGCICGWENPEEYEEFEEE